MAYGGVKIKYGEDILKKYWDHIVSVAAPYGREDEAAEDVSKLRNSLVECARCEP